MRRGQQRQRGLLHTHHAVANIRRGWKDERRRFFLRRGKCHSSRRRSEICTLSIYCRAADASWIALCVAEVADPSRVSLECPTHLHFRGLFVSSTGHVFPFHTPDDVCRLR